MVRHYDGFGELLGCAVLSNCIEPAPITPENLIKLRAGDKKLEDPLGEDNRFQVPDNDVTRRPVFFTGHVVPIRSFATSPCDMDRRGIGARPKAQLVGTTVREK